MLRTMYVTITVPNKVTLDNAQTYQEYHYISDVEITKTDMRPELLDLIQDIVTSKIVAISDIKESAKQVWIPLISDIDNVYFLVIQTILSL